MSNITAALGIAQLMKVNKIIEKRRRNAEFYAKNLAERVEEITTLLPPRNYYNVYQMYTIRSRQRNELMKYLADKGIATKVYFHPVHLSHYYRIVEKTKCRLPVTEEISREILALPMYPDLRRNQIGYIVDEIEEFYSSSLQDTEMKRSQKNTTKKEFLAR
jgi:perosamine synthetase